MKELRKLNFNKLITIGVPDITGYSYDEYKANGFKHKSITGYCVSCEEKGCSTASDDAAYQLTTISHGAHSSDFFQAYKEKQDISDWHHEPIMFVYESPGRNNDIYKKERYNGYDKQPSKTWYWIDSDWDRPIAYPEGFKGGVYGTFVWCATLTFKLANVYVTNLVKCGLNNAKGDYKNLDWFKDETVKTCYSNFLKEEIAILKPKIIFAVGSRVERKVRQFVKDLCLVQQLPHPAAQQGGGLRDDHYKAIYFWGVVRALHKADIINTDECCELAKLYLENYEANFET